MCIPNLARMFLTLVHDSRYTLFTSFVNFIEIIMTHVLYYVICVINGRCDLLVPIILSCLKILHVIEIHVHDLISKSLCLPKEWLIYLGDRPISVET